MASQLTESQLTDIVEAVCIYREYTVSYLYVAVVDDATCNNCLDHEGTIFTFEEIESYFPDYEWEGVKIDPNVHITTWGKDTCRCRLYPLEGDGGLPDKLSDKDYEDKLAALLAMGQIAASLYDLIMAQRKKRKEQPKK